MASRRTPSTGALESFCEFFSCMQLEYCLREPLSKFEGLSTFYCNFINVNILYCIYGTFGPFLLYVYTTVRIILWTFRESTQSCSQKLLELYTEGWMKGAGDKGRHTHTHTHRLTLLSITPSQNLMWLFVSSVLSALVPPREWDNAPSLSQEPSTHTSTQTAFIETHTHTHYTSQAFIHSLVHT